MHPAGLLHPLKADDVFARVKPMLEAIGKSALGLDSLMFNVSRQGKA